MARPTKLEVFMRGHPSAGLRPSSRTSCRSPARASYTRQEVIAAFQSIIDAQKATESASAAYDTALEKERALLKSTRGIRNAYRSYVEATLGKGNATIALMGFKSKVAATPTVEVKVAAAEKRRA